VSPPSLLAVIVAYLLGSIPFGYLLVKCWRGQDVRATGSGSIGATNVSRVLGALGGLLTLLFDLAKGYAAVWLTAVLTGQEVHWLAAAGLAAILGHMFPVFLRFRGGKGVATGLGVFIYFTPWAVAVAVILWLLVVAVWRYISLGSILATAAYPVFAYALYQPALPVTLAAIVAASLIIIRHAGNIQHLVAGTERKFKLRYKS